MIEKNFLPCLLPSAPLRGATDAAWGRGSRDGKKKRERTPAKGGTAAKRVLKAAARSFWRASSKPQPSRPSTKVQFLLPTLRQATVTRPPRRVARSAAASGDGAAGGARATV